MAETLLWLPIQVDALRLAADQPAVAPASFDRLPYATDGLDHNVGAPFLARTTHPAPFAAPGFVLGKGVHLHWTLPTALRTQTHPREGGVEQRDRLEFPAAPDQWLVRRIVGGAVEATWRVDAGFLWAPDADDAVAGPHASIWPWRLVQDPGTGAWRYEVPTGHRPYRWVGRRWQVTPGRIDTPPPGERLPVPLRADGWGDPTFSAYYPACRGVFGHWDEDVANPRDATYQVLGWYGDPANDPLQRLHDEGRPDPAAELARRWGWTFDGKGIPERLVCVGAVGPGQHTLPATSQGPIEVRLALGDTATEAVAALLARSLHPGESDEVIEARARMERQLDAVLFARHLDGHEVDVGGRLDEHRRRRGFCASAGGTSWVLREAPGKGEAAAEVNLPDALIIEVDALNAAQETLDRARSRVEAMRAGVYADWHRAMEFTDPEEAFARGWVTAERDPRNPLTAESMLRHLVQAALPALREAIAEADAAAAERDHRFAGLGAAVNAHNAQPGAAEWTLDPTPGPRFYAPNDPVVALLPVVDLSADRGAGEGLPCDDAGRLRGWTLDGTLGADGPLPELGAALPEAVADLGHPGLNAGHVHIFAMEWRVHFGADEVGPDDDSADYPVDWLEARPESAEPPARQAAEVLTGRALMVPGADAVVESALFDYLRARLAERCVGVLPGAPPVPLHPITAARRPPKGMVWRSWVELEGATELDAGAVTRDAAQIRLWARQEAGASALLAGAAALEAWPPLPDRAGGPRIWGFRSDGTVAQALMTALRSLTKEAMEERLGLPEELCAALAAASNGDLTAITRAAAPYGAVAATALLRWSEAKGFLRSDHEPVPGLADTALHFGLPDGGVLAATVCRLVDTLDEEALLREVQLDEEVVGRLLEARPLASLADLAVLPCVHVDTIARLVAHAEDHGGLVTPALADSAGFRRVVREDPIGAVMDAWLALRRQPRAWTHSLDGFNDALLQWEPGPQLPVADPVGFPDYREFAARVVAPAVGTAPRRAPRTDTGFHPLRSGVLALAGLRLIDAFGLVAQEFDQASLAELAVPDDRRPRAGAGWHSTLPPRITQAARLDLRWCAGATSAAPWTPHPNTTPIRGWLAADNIDGSLTVFRSDGELLGALTEAGWRLAPGRSGPVLPTEIEDAALRGLVLHLLARAEAEPEGFLERLLDIIDEALDNIHPPVAADEEALALFMSRPLAVVRARIAVELDGPPATRQDGRATGERLAALPPPDRRFTSVRVPLRVGAHHLLRDGVVAWFEEDSAGAVTGSMRLPLQDTHDLGVPLVDPDGPRTLLLLVDPQGAMHVEGECLPPARLDLPATSYAAALRHLDLCTFSGPHLGPVGQLRMPVPHLSGWSTTFRSREPGGWRDLDPRDQIDRAVIEAAFLPIDGGPSLWSRLIADGVIAETEPGSDRGWLVPPPQEHPLTLDQRLAAYPNGAALARLILSRARRLALPAESHAGEPLELREGWLWLRRESS